MRFALINNFSFELSAALPSAAIDFSPPEEVVTALQSFKTAEDEVIALTLFTVDGLGVENKRETVYVTSINTETGVVEIDRAQEGTLAANFLAGDTVEARLTAAMLKNMPQGMTGDVTGQPIKGKVAFGAGYTDGGDTYPPAQSVADRAVALGVGSMASNASATAIGAAFEGTIGGAATSIQGAQASGSGSTALGTGSVTSADLSTAIGYGSMAGGEKAVAIGDGSSSYGDSAAAIGKDAYANGDNSVALGFGASTYGVGSVALSGAYVSGENSIGFGDQCSVYSNYSVAFLGSANGLHAVSIGQDSNAQAERATALGYDAQANAVDTVCLGSGANANSTKAIAVGAGAAANPPQAIVVGPDASSQAPENIAIGAGATAAPPYSIALGRSALTQMTGGLQINALSYLPATYNQTGEDAGPPPPVTRQSAFQVIIGTDSLDLASAASEETLAIPDGGLLFIDSIDVVITSASGAGGAPAVEVGATSADPDEFLAAGAVTKTTVGGRDTFEPLSRDGTSSLYVSVATAGTGTYAAKVIIRGYVALL